MCVAAAYSRQSRAESRFFRGGAAEASYAHRRQRLTAFSSDWSDFTGECNTKDPDGYQHLCCDASSGMPWQEPCPTTKGLESIIGLSVWSDGVLGNFSISIRSISIEN